jgi:predicted HAD superfamily Cof-like phosphohydrolase
MKYYDQHKKFQFKVLEFMKTFEQKVSLTPITIQEIIQDNETLKIVDLRKRLFLEEYEELMTAFSSQTLVDVADAIVDSLYISYGTLNYLGLPHETSVCEYDKIIDSERENLSDVYSLKRVYTTIIEIFDKIINNNFQPEYSFQNKSKLEMNPIFHLWQALCKFNILLFEMAGKLGLDLDNLFNEVHNSNMSKLDENGNVLKNEFGKVIKSSSYVKPDLTKFLNLEELLKL